MIAHILVLNLLRSSLALRTYFKLTPEFPSFAIHSDLLPKRGPLEFESCSECTFQVDATFKSCRSLQADNVTCLDAPLFSTNLTSFDPRQCRKFGDGDAFGCYWEVKAAVLVLAHKEIRPDLRPFVYALSVRVKEWVPQMPFHVFAPDDPAYNLFSTHFESTVTAMLTFVSPIFYNRIFVHDDKESTLNVSVYIGSAPGANSTPAYYPIDEDAGALVYASCLTLIIPPGDNYELYYDRNNQLEFKVINADSYLFATPGLVWPFEDLDRIAKCTTLEFQSAEGDLAYFRFVVNAVREGYYAFEVAYDELAVLLAQSSCQFIIFDDYVSSKFCRSAEQMTPDTGVSFHVEVVRSLEFLSGVPNCTVSHDYVIRTELPVFITDTTNFMTDTTTDLLPTVRTKPTTQTTIASASPPTTLRTQKGSTRTTSTPPSTGSQKVASTAPEEASTRLAAPAQHCFGFVASLIVPHVVLKSIA